MTTRMLFVLSEDPDDVADEYVAWNAEHIRFMAGLPGIVSAQAFRIDPDFEMRFGDRPKTPRYRNLNVFEVDEGFAGPSPDTPMPDQPGGVGPNRPAPFVFVATTEQFTGSPA